jgi:hypothetical protein
LDLNRFDFLVPAVWATANGWAILNPRAAKIALLTPPDCEKARLQAINSLDWGGIPGLSLVVEGKRGEECVLKENLEEKNKK